MLTGQKRERPTPDDPSRPLSRTPAVAQSRSSAPVSSSATTTDDPPNKSRRLQPQITVSPISTVVNGLTLYRIGLRRTLIRENGRVCLSKNGTINEAAVSELVKTKWLELPQRDKDLWNADAEVLRANYVKDVTKGRSYSHRQGGTATATATTIATAAPGQEEVVNPVAVAVPQPPQETLAVSQQAAPADETHKKVVAPAIVEQKNPE